MPNPETFRTWLRAIHRDSYEVTSNSRVCIKHFDERYIIKEDTVTRPDGTILTVKGSAKIKERCGSNNF
ncbi:hypothetical protein J6590_086578 [Homalodisca vitripennis]|nr:hypothetical protein J6590_086578 [Homalodisca vitripennis]